MIKCGTSAVPDPCRAIVGLGIPSNSATPPFVMLVLDWLAITSRSLATADAPVKRVWGSIPVEVVMSCPRKPWILATPDQLSFAVISVVIAQFWVKAPPESAYSSNRRF